MQNVKGRPRIEVPPELFAEQEKKYHARKITAYQAAAALGISRMTFIRRINANKANNRPN